MSNEWFSTYLPNGVTGTVISLSRMGLTSIPTELFSIIQNSDITVLDLSFNNLSNISSLLNQCTNLKEIWLNNNQLTTLPNLSDLNLTRINISYNQLSNLSDINSFIIDVSYNQITTISNLSNNTCILALNNNKLSDLPIEICQLPNLQVLNICNNLITDINAITSSLTHPLAEFWYE